MNIIIKKYSEQDFQTWDGFVDTCYNAIFFHKRLFLSYHGDRFNDESLLIYDDNRLVALLPAAIDPQDDRKIVSHPGLTFGGLLHNGFLRGENCVLVFEKIIEYYKANGFKKILYKVIPFFYNQAPAQDDLYALIRLDAKRIRCDLTATINLDYYLPIRSERRIRSLKKSMIAGLEIKEGYQDLSIFWQLMEENLYNRHKLKPTHNIDEISLLIERFPSNIKCVFAYNQQTLIGGTVLFETPTAIHTQYLGCNDEGRKLSALDAIINYCIELSIENKKTWFDFGNSNENHGRIVNNGLHLFKTQFGAGGAVHEYYEIIL